MSKFSSEQQDYLIRLGSQVDEGRQVIISDLLFSESFESRANNLVHKGHMSQESADWLISFHGLLKEKGVLQLL